MERLADALKYYVHERLQNDALWKGLVVIFSDSQVPGEGEHKILEFICLQRAQEGYNPNTCHCLYGADADLIMLGLSTHEVNFYIIREVFIQPFDRVCSLCGQKGHITGDCQHAAANAKKVYDKVEFQFINIWRVREYLELDFRKVELPFLKDFERIIDDFVFLCFFVGNDFLPHLPSLYIRQGAIDCILMVYKKLLPSLGGYLTQEGNIDFRRADVLFKKLGEIEEELLRDKQMRDERDQRNQKVNYNQAPDLNQYLDKREAELKANIEKLHGIYAGYIKKADSFQEKEKFKNDFSVKTEVLKKELAEVQKKIEQQKAKTEAMKVAYPPPIVKSDNKIYEGMSLEEKNKFALEQFNKEVKEMMKVEGENDAKKYEDTIQYGKEGYKARYYIEKLNVAPSEFPEFRKIIQRYYLEGLSWVLAYYYNGCVSWSWYYPFHYSPLASDLLGSDELGPLQ